MRSIYKWSTTRSVDCGRVWILATWKLNTTQTMCNKNRWLLGLHSSHWWPITIISQYSSVGVLRRLKGCQQVWATDALRWSIDSIVTSVRQADNKKQTQYLQGISGQRRKLSLLKKMTRKCLTSFLDVLHCRSWFIVFLCTSQCLTYALVGLYTSTTLYFTVGDHDGQDIHDNYNKGIYCCNLVK